MTQEKMNDINAWTKRINKSQMDVQDQMVIANAAVRMLEEIDPIYDKYTAKEQQNGGKRKGEFFH